MRLFVVLIAVLSLVSAGCADDPTSSEEFAELEQQLAAAEQLLADQDGSSAPGGGDRPRALATIEQIKGMLDDPESFGSEEEVADLIGEHAADGALMDDEVFGAVPYRDGFYNTLYSGAVDARIDIHHFWVSHDGSQGGTLWMWYGNNARGKPFELAGISLIDFDEQGRVAYELVTYPYSDEYVGEAVFGEGTARVATAAASSSTDRFRFEDDDMHEWVSEADVAEWIASEFEWDGTVTEVPTSDAGGGYEWRLESLGTEDGSLLADDASRWEYIGGGTYDFDVRVAADGISSYSDGPIEIGAFVVGHPSVSDGVVIHNGGFGQFAFSVPPGPWLQVSVWLDSDAEGEAFDWEDHEARWFAVADHFLHELGWMPSQG